MEEVKMLPLYFVVSRECGRVYRVYTGHYQAWLVDYDDLIEGGNARFIAIILVNC